MCVGGFDVTALDLERQRLFFYLFIFISFTDVLSSSVVSVSACG